MSNEFTTIKEMLEDIDMKINHVEDMVADHRTVIVKLVKQNNTIVKFLRELDDDIHDSYQEEYGESLPTPSRFIKEHKLADVQELIDEYMEKNKGLKELEKELEENKDKITPGLHGES